MNLEEPLNSPKYDIADQHVKKLHNGYELDVKRSSSGHVFTNFPSTNLRVFSTKYNVILFILICWSAQKWEKMPCLNNKEFVVVVFQLRNIGEKIRRFVFGSIHIWRQMFLGHFWPTYPNQVLYYISLFSKNAAGST